MWSQGACTCKWPVLAFLLNVPHAHPRHTRVVPMARMQSGVCTCRPAAVEAKHSTYGQQ